MIRNKTFTCAMLATIMLTGLTHGASIYIDFGNDGVLAGNSDGDGNHWNVVDGGSSSVIDQLLSYTTGTNSGVTISYELINGGGFGNFEGPASTDPYDEFAVTRDSVYNNTTATHPITFKNLAADTEYTFSMISRHGSGGTAVNGLITLLTGTSSDIGSGLTLTVNGSILTYKATSDSSGTIKLGITRQGGGGTRLSAMTIQGVPEPSSLSIILIGLGLITLRRNRHATRY